MRIENKTEIFEVFSTNMELKRLSMEIMLVVEVLNKWWFEKDLNKIELMADGLKEFSLKCFQKQMNS